LVRYQKFDILTLGIVSDIVVIAVDDITPTQAEEPIMGIGVEDIHVEVSTEKSLTVEPLFKVTTQEIIIAPNHEAPVVTSEMRQPLTQLAPTLLGETNVSPSTSESLHYDCRDWIRKCSFGTDTRYGYPRRTVPPNGQAILHQMKYCIELVLSG